MKKVFDLLFIIVICLTFVFFGEKSGGNYWTILQSLDYTMNYDEKLDDIVINPKWNPSIEALDGKRVQLSGYYYQPKEDGKVYFVEKMDIEIAHRGVGALMELAIEDKKIKLHFGKKCMLQGRLVLNKTDRSKLPYQLKEAECLRCIN